MLLRRRASARTELDSPPLFIIGHWRTGTTLLHELLILDPRHTFPTTLPVPGAEPLPADREDLHKRCALPVPAQRPMDNMAAGWDRPQEDEFALCMLGLPSPYQTIAFPQPPAADPDRSTWTACPAATARRWKRDVSPLPASADFRDPRRLVLKSPPHTARIPVLLELFPDAHSSTSSATLRRVPVHGQPVESVSPQTWAATSGMFVVGGIRLFDLSADVREIRGRKATDCASRFHELKYEDLTRDPIGQMQTLYETLNLGGFDAGPAKAGRVYESNEGIRNEQISTCSGTSGRDRDRWGEWIRRWGYVEPG